MRLAPISAHELVAVARYGIEEISPGELQRRVKSGAWLIDVREPAEFAAGNIAGAVCIPRGVLEFQVEASPATGGTTGSIPREQPIVVYCRSGDRAALAVQSLEDMGFHAVASLAGGILDWQNEGRPLVMGD